MCIVGCIFALIYLGAKITGEVNPIWENLLLGTCLLALSYFLFIVGNFLYSHWEESSEMTQIFEAQKVKKTKFRR